jgi:hypothetical protein
MKPIKDKLRDPHFVTPNELYLRVAEEFGGWDSLPLDLNFPWNLINGLEDSIFSIVRSTKRRDQSFE